MPKYSIIIPTYNRANLVSSAIDSVLRQTCRDFEIVVCDDGSTDGTDKVLDRYGDTIRRVKSNRSGPGGARNAAIAQATGRYIACLDSDDMWMPWTLECVDQAIASAAPDCLVYLKIYPLTPALDVNTVARTPLSVRQYADFLSAPLDAPHGSCSIGAIPRELLAKVDFFDSSIVGAEDHDLLLRLGADIPYVVVESPPTLLYMRHDSNISGSNPALHIANYTKIIAKEMKLHLYAGGAARRRERRVRIGEMAAAFAYKFVWSREYKQAMVLYRRVLGLMLSIFCWRFVVFFPLMASFHLIANPANLFDRRGH